MQSDKTIDILPRPRGRKRVSRPTMRCLLQYMVISILMAKIETKLNCDLSVEVESMKCDLAEPKRSRRVVGSQAHGELRHPVGGVRETSEEKGRGTLGHPRNDHVVE